MTDAELDALEAAAKKLQKRGSGDPWAVQNYEDLASPEAVLELIQRVREMEKRSAKEDKINT